MGQLKHLEHHLYVKNQSSQVHHCFNKTFGTYFIKIDTVANQDKHSCARHVGNNGRIDIMERSVTDRCSHDGVIIEGIHF